MLTMYYKVASIDGDYAHLLRTDDGSNSEILVALALLPEGLKEGMELKYEMLQYEIVG